MSSSSNSNPNLSPNEQICFCGQRSPLRTSFTEENPGRRFVGCINYKTNCKCKFFDWIDPPTCTRGMDFGNHVIKMLRKVEAENAALKDKMQKIERENADLKTSISENEKEIESLMNLVRKQSGEVQQLSKQNEQAIKRSEDLVNLLTLSRRQEWHLKLIVLALALALAVICFPMFSKYYNVPSDKFLALP
ncbi:uncharacterized protein LOC131313922 [Rhododendron vialii]|uniref:uncharacterized protein LOC131313922 n=1 Tax=Rhododendron vialii TaxID=182163 RepID=UPI00265F9F19|nr:uncharacterized protein LOC131313922 [Rhododendron vialii]